MEIKNLFVVGAGTMGAGIGQLAAQNNIKATVMDTDEKIIENAKNKITSGLERRIAKGKITEQDKDSILAKIFWTTDINEAKDADFVIEAVFENINIKKELFKKLDNICSANVVLASNTTALSITEISSATNRQDKVIGMHFFNPAVIMKLVEIIRGENTSEDTINAAKAFAETLGKTPIVTNKEAPAGIVSRVLAGMLNEAVSVYADGIADAKDIDTAMQLGAGLPMGPLTLIDLIGIDIHVAKMNTLYEKLKEEKYKPHSVLLKMVEEGKLGKKSGQGFYSY